MKLFKNHLLVFNVKGLLVSSRPFIFGALATLMLFVYPGLLAIGYAEDNPVASLTIEELTPLYNEILNDIYAYVMSVKDEYPELKNFGENTLGKNQYGIETVDYNAQAADLGYSFGLSIVKIDDPNPFRSDKTAFDYGFPVLGIKFTGFQRRLAHRDRFDILKVVQYYGQRLLEEQRKFMPLILTVTPIKETFQVGENIEFIVSLKNQAKTNFAVKPLNTQTLSFIYDDVIWGAKEKNTKKADNKEIILSPGEEVARKFIGSSFPQARQLEVYCSYIKTYKGISAFDILKINIIE